MTTKTKKQFFGQNKFQKVYFFIFNQFIKVKMLFNWKIYNFILLVYYRIKICLKNHYYHIMFYYVKEEGQNMLQKLC